LDVFEENIDGLREVWKELNSVWNVVLQLRDQTLLSVKPKFIRDQMDDA
jgi:hypothetical protein